jgi:hypothetical protein
VVRFGAAALLGAAFLEVFFAAALFTVFFAGLADRLAAEDFFFALFLAVFFAAPARLSAAPPLVRFPARAFVFFLEIERFLDLAMCDVPPKCNGDSIGPKLGKAEQNSTDRLKIL